MLKASDLVEIRFQSNPVQCFPGQTHVLPLSWSRGWGHRSTTSPWVSVDLTLMSLKASDPSVGDRLLPAVRCVAVWRTLGSLLGMKNLRPHLTPTESDCFLAGCDSPAPHSWRNAAYKMPPRSHCLPRLLWKPPSLASPPMSLLFS